MTEEDFEKGEALGDDLAKPVELEDVPALHDDLDENPDDLAGDEVDPDFDLEEEVEVK